MSHIHFCLVHLVKNLQRLEMLAKADSKVYTVGCHGVFSKSEIRC